MAASERISVLVTPAEKRRIAKLSKAAGLSMGEFMRRAAASFRPSDEDKALEWMLGQVAKTTARAGAAVDRALTFIEKTNARIARMEKGTASRRAAT
jgi:hypothetical protein